MLWIESHTNLAGHPKTKKFCRLLKTTIPQAIGHLHCFWWWAMEYAQDGEITGYSPEDIAEVAMWEGDPH
jgi:hypothetical protein